MAFYDFKTEISPLGAHLANAYFKEVGSSDYPIDPEIIASKFFGLHIEPVRQIASIGVLSGLDATQSILFIDESIYMSDDHQHLARQAIAHEIGHIIYDTVTLRSMTPRTVDEAYEVHASLGAVSSLEPRANMFAGALLVPRQELIKRSFTVLNDNLEQVQLANPDMEVQQVLSALGGSRLTRYFGVSDQVIDWRMKNEELYELLGLNPTSPISQLNPKTLQRVLELPIEVPELTARIKTLIPQELLLRFSQ